MDRKYNDELNSFSIIDYEDESIKGSPNRKNTVAIHSVESDFEDINSDEYPDKNNTKQTVVQPLTMSSEKARKLRQSKYDIISRSATNYRKGSRPPKPKDPELSPIDDSFVEVSYEEPPGKVYLDRSKIEIANNDFYSGDFDECASDVIDQSDHNYDTMRQIEDTYVSISQSDYEGINDQDDFVNNIKGAVLEHFTNFNYYLNDTGIMGVKKLDFKEDGPIVKLFNKHYPITHKNHFSEDFEKIIWITYRNNFKTLFKRKDFLQKVGFDHKQVKIDSNKLTSDNGWGCMIRVSQMIMANALNRHKSENPLPGVEDYFEQQRESMSSLCDVQEELENEQEHKRSIIRLFLDNLRGRKSPFSIQNFVEHGYIRYKKLPGEWYGSNSAAIILQELNSKYKPEEKLEIVIFNENGIFEEKWIKIAGHNNTNLTNNKTHHKYNCEKPSDSPVFNYDKKPYLEESKTMQPYDFSSPSKSDDLEQDFDGFDFDTKRQIEPSPKAWWKSLFIIQCIRLGMESVSKEFFSSIKLAFEIPHCVGIMGGRPNKALYFVGHEGDNLIFLDPHFVSDAILAKDYDNFDIESYTWNQAKKLPMQNLDPCLAFGYYIKDENDFELFKKCVKTQQKRDANFKYICDVHDMFERF